MEPSKHHPPLRNFLLNSRNFGQPKEGQASSTDLLNTRKKGPKKSYRTQVVSASLPGPFDETKLSDPKFKSYQIRVHCYQLTMVLWVGRYYSVIYESATHGVTKCSSGNSFESLISANNYITVFQTLASCRNKLVFIYVLWWGSFKTTKWGARNEFVL